MEELESQIAKILLGNTKSSSTYVFVLAEKAQGSDAELYMVAELPLLNPAAEEACERICQAIASALKRSYQNNARPEDFENAISTINEELGKLAGMGQTQWIDKLNCILAVKEGLNFQITSCGKISAYLLRGREFTDISCSAAKSHPLKTFETFAGGKIRLGDLLILSTTQLFNYISMDRLRTVVSETDFLTATRTIIQVLKSSADPQISFGVVLNLQVLAGQTPEEATELENYQETREPASVNLLSKGLAYVKTALTLEGTTKRRPTVSLPKVSINDRLKNFGGEAKNIINRGKKFWHTARSSAQNVKDNVSRQKFKQWSPAKKFLFLSILILFVAAVANIFIATYVNKNRAHTAQINTELKNAQTFLANAQASLLYKDDAAAANYFVSAQSSLPKASDVDSGDKALYNTVLAMVSDTQKLLEKIYEPQVSNLGSLPGDSLIKLPGQLAVQTKNSIISYNLTSGAVLDGSLSAGNLTILASNDLAASTAAVYDGTSLYVWDFTTGKLSPGFSQNVPQKADFGGLAQYPTNGRVYMLDKTTAQIISFLPSKTGFSRPVISASDSSLSQAVDLAIDGSIYVLSKTGVNKFQGGKLADFSLPNLPVPLSGSGKIATQKDFVNIYILDAGNKRILIFDKHGNLVNTLTSSQFTNLKDFLVDEKNKVIYVLNDGSLLKVSLP